jgi:16S rRNA G527 N7-methylase RsmG
MKRTLRLEGLDIRNQRIEDLRDIKVDAAVTRALFSIKEFVAKAGGLLHGPKVLILSKGPKLENELDGVFSSAVQTIPISLPFQNVTRHLVVIRVRP